MTLQESKLWSALLETQHWVDCPYFGVKMVRVRLKLPQATLNRPLNPHAGRPGCWTKTDQHSSEFSRDFFPFPDAEVEYVSTEILCYRSLFKQQSNILWSALTEVKAYKSDRLNIVTGLHVCIGSVLIAQQKFLSWFPSSASEKSTSYSEGWSGEVPLLLTVPCFPSWLWHWIWQWKRNTCTYTLISVWER